MFRPVVPIGFAATTMLPLIALVDSGCEHTLAASWLADELGVDLRLSDERLLLGVGGRTVEAVFAPVEVRLHREHESDDIVSWWTDVGFLDPWDAEFFVILGQTGFFDQFTITMNRRVLTVVVQDVETPLAQ